MGHCLTIMKKLESLQSALNARNNEFVEYQINIDNYTRAIDKINAEHQNNPAMI